MLGFLLDLSWNPAHVRARQKVPKPRGARAARTRAPRRPAPRDGGSKAAHSGAADDGAHRGAYRARRGAQRAAHSTHHRGDAGEPRDRSAGRLRPTADCPAQRSDDRGAHDDDGGRSARDGSVDQADGRTRPLSWLRNAVVFASRGRLAAAAPGRASTRIAGAGFGAAGSDEETFPGCKALKCHETGLESANWSSPPRSSRGGVQEQLWPRPAPPPPPPPPPPRAGAARAAA